MNSLDLRIWGMTLSKMNDLSTMGLTITIGNPQVLNNQIILEAGDDDSGMSVVHHETIYHAWVDPPGDARRCISLNVKHRIAGGGEGRGADRLPWSRRRVNHHVVGRRARGVELPEQRRNREAGGC
jgi:hypothetical protein